LLQGGHTNRLPGYLSLVYVADSSFAAFTRQTKNLQHKPEKITVPEQKVDVDRLNTNGSHSESPCQMYLQLQPALTALVQLN
jgi:hypothetical protein